MPIHTRSTRLFTRTLVLASTLLYCLSAAVTADEVLYKWREADGSLTFSPIPPAKDSGIKYEIVGSENGLARIEPAQIKQPTFAAKSATVQTPSQAQRSSHRKRAQCSELQKRVQSLERLLRTDISAETMDNAVVQMARYQNSFNQSCNRSLRN